MKVSFHSKTDVGLKRDHNEDSFGVCPEKNFFFVCDGMGGHAAGDFASQTVVDTLLKLIKKRVGGGDLRDISLETPPEIPAAGRELVSHIMLANRRLFKLEVMYPKLRGMGTTLSAIRFENAHCHILNVGDSRVYRYRNSTLEQMTVDHSWVEEMLQDGEISEKELHSFGAKNVITRALGTNPVVQVDWKASRLADGDIFLLCTDGLCGEIDDSQISYILETHGNNLAAAAEALVKAAKEAGGSDNITVILAEVTSPRKEIPANLPLDAVKTLHADEESVRLMDKFIDKNLPPKKTPVPKGVFKEKKKLYQIPFFQAVAILLLLTGGALLISRPWVPEEILTMSESMTGDIIFRTTPPGASVSLYSGTELVGVKSSPASFMTLDEGSYRAEIELSGYEKISLNLYSERGQQNIQNIPLIKQAELYLTLGHNHGFREESIIYINNEPWEYFGSPLTVRRVGVVGKSISLERNTEHTLKVENIERTVRLNENQEDITLILDRGRILVER